MKRKQVTAILLSAIMTVSACVPMNGIGALAAENAEAQNTETAFTEEQSEEPELTEAEEADAESVAGSQADVTEEQEADIPEAAEEEEDLPDAAEEREDPSNAAEQEENVSDAEVQEAADLADTEEQEEAGSCCTGKVSRQVSRVGTKAERCDGCFRQIKADASFLP